MRNAPPPLVCAVRGIAQGDVLRVCDADMGGRRLFWIEVNVGRIHIHRLINGHADIRAAAFCDADGFASKAA